MICLWASGTPYVDQWLMYEEINGEKVNLVKLLRPVTEQLINGQQGPVKQKIFGQFEFYPIEFFMDDSVFDIDGLNVYRSLSSGEELLNSYDNVIKSYKHQKIQAEAERKMRSVGGEVSQ